VGLVQQPASPAAEADEVPQAVGVENEHLGGPRFAGVAALAAGWRPDVVLLDLMMPGVDGLALNLIKQHDPEIQVIILTGHGSTESGIIGMQRGLFDFIMKPVDIAAGDRRTHC